jgi:magnesium chelatase subunit I
MKALAALDNRKEVTVEDLHVIAPMALRMRRSPFIEKYLSEQSNEEDEISKAVGSTISSGK